MSCAKCQKDNDVSLKSCGRCLQVRYCSSECQKQDWHRHKLTDCCCTVLYVPADSSIPISVKKLPPSKNRILHALDLITEKQWLSVHVDGVVSKKAAQVGFALTILFNADINKKDMPVHEKQYHRINTRASSISPGAKPIYGPCLFLAEDNVFIRSLSLADARTLLIGSEWSRKNEAPTYWLLFSNDSPPEEFTFEQGKTSLDTAKTIFTDCLVGLQKRLLKEQAQYRVYMMYSTSASNPINTCVSRFLQTPDEVIKGTVMIYTEDCVGLRKSNLD